MDENRGQQRPAPQNAGGTIWVSETLCNGAAAATNAAEKEPKEEKVSAFWRIFGGTILSILALVVVTLYQGLTSSVGELRNEVGYLSKDLRKDMGRLGETQGDLVKKEEFSMRMRSIWDTIKELRTDNTSFVVVKERTAALEQQLKVAEEERKLLMRELQRLREAKAVDEERKELLRELQRLSERLATVEGRQPTTQGAKPAAPRD